MRLSQQAQLRIEDRDLQQTISQTHRLANNRKRVVYWIGFIEGVLASKRIEAGEEDALLTEAANFARFFDDPDASDLFEDLNSKCFSSDRDLIDQLVQIADEKRAYIENTAIYTEVDKANEFLGFCAGIVCDGLILETEAFAILTKLTNSRLGETAAFSSLHSAVKEALSDGVLTIEESEDVRDWISHLVGDGFADTGLPNIGHVASLGDPISDPKCISLTGANLVLTGPMRMGPRSFIVSEIERCGGRVQGAPGKKTDYVVVSDNASRHWKTTHFGTKIERAKELMELGCKLRFVTESALEKSIAHQIRGGSS